MAYADGNIIIGTTVDVGGIDSGLHKIKKSFKKLGFVAGSAGVLTLATRGFWKLGKAAIDAASDLQEVQNVVDVAFKDMSYKIEEFSKVCISYFGMSELGAKQTAGSFMSMATSIGIVRETASDMAVELAGLSGDFASFYNISQEYAKVALAAVFTGETETMKRYGIILTEANLQEYALTLGIEKKVKKMSAEEKALLRYNYVMQSTQHIHGDFQRTQENWANTVRVLKERWYELMIAMGTIFMQKVQPVVNLLNTIISKLISIFKYLQQLLGITSEIGDATFADEMEEMADAVDDVGSAIKHQLAPFDKLNNLTSKAGSGVDDDLSDLQKLYDEAKLSGYVIDAMKNFELQVTELSDSMKSKLANMVNLFKRAKYKIELLWNNIRLNHWFSAGMNFGDMIASLERFISESISGVDWQKKGEEIGEFFKGIIWSDALGGWVDILISALDGIITLAIAGIEKIDLADIIKMAQNYSKAARKFFRWVFKTLKKVDWTGLGKKLGTFIENIDWGGIFEDVIEVVFQAFVSAVRFYKGVFDGAPIATTLISGIVAAFTLAKWTGLSSALSTSFGMAVKNWRKGLVDKDGKLHLDSKAGKAFQGALGAITLGLSVGLAINKWEKIKSSDIDAKGLYARLMDLGSAIGAAFGVKLLASAFGVSMGPAGVLLTFAGVLGLNIALDFILQPTDEQKSRKLQKDLEDAINTVDWVSQINDTIDVLVNLKVNAEGRIDEVTGDISYYRDMAKTWEELSEHYDELTEGEKRLVKLYSEQMITKFPEVTEKVNELTGAYEGTASALDLLIQKSEDYLKIQAYTELKQEAYKQLFAGEIQLEDLKKRQFQLEQEKEDIDDYLISMLKLNVSYEKLQELWESYGRTDINSTEEFIRSVLAPEVKRALQKGQTEWEGISFLSWGYHTFDDILPEGFQNVWGLFNSGSILTKKFVELNGAINTAKDTLAYFDDQINTLTDTIEKEELQTSLDKLKDVFEDTFGDVASTWSDDIKDAIDAIQKKLEEGEEVTINDVAYLYTIINKGLNGLSEGELPEDVQKAMGKLAEKMREGKTTLSEAVAELASIIVSGFKSGLGDNKENTGVFGALQKTKENLIDALKKKDPSLITPASTFIKNLFDWSSEPGKKEGEELQNNLVNGLVTITPANRKKIEKSGEFVLDRWIESGESTAKINSPSKVMRDDVGENLIDGLILGINDGMNELIASAKDVVNALVETFDVVQLTPNMTIVPDVDLANAHIPDIVNGMVVPAQVSGETNVSNTVGGMNKSELSEVLAQALSNLVLGLDLNVNEDSMFKSMQNKAKIYKQRTHSAPFG